MSRPGALNSWTVIPRPSPNARLRLFCFPYAGGGASVFYAWPRGLPPEVEVVAVQPPGREGRLMETPIASMDALVDAMYPTLLPLMDRPFALFGHSNGGLMAFEVARRLRREGRTLPVRLFGSGRPAPQVPLTLPPLHTLSDEDFVHELRRLNGTPEEVLANEEIMRLVLPLLRADFAIGETYRYRDEPPLDVPIAAYGGERDAEVPYEHVQAWREQTTGDFVLRMFPGDHFFINGDRDLVLRQLSLDLREHIRPDGR
ncbi:MAG TPA: alpha/beta fold hydrolase [Longimicrobium sp.]|nr:alpha/beta fold hydrolase [Longimicrobium sp.]